MLDPLELSAPASVVEGLADLLPSSMILQTCCLLQQMFLPKDHKCKGYSNQWIQLLWTMVTHSSQQLYFSFFLPTKLQKNKIRKK